MFKYIKWELKDIINKKLIWFLSIAIIYLLTFLSLKIEVGEGIISGICIIVCALCFINAFIAGAKRTMKTFENKTFLLESMIPISSDKLLLGKYLISIIINIFYVIAYLIGVGVIFMGIGGDVFNFVKDIIFSNFSEFLTLLFQLASFAVAYTSVTTLIFISLKCIWPNAKKIKMISYIAGYFGIALISSIFDFDSREIIWLIMLLISVVSYFITTILIKEKLEVYS